MNRSFYCASTLAVVFFATSLLWISGVMAEPNEYIFGCTFVSGLLFGIVLWIISSAAHKDKEDEKKETNNDN